MARDSQGRDAPTGHDPLTAELLDVLVSDVRAMTTRLHALLALQVGAAPPDAELLTRSSEEARSIGWQLAVLASAAGNDVLLARRERDGLGRFLELVRAALARTGRVLEIPAGLPRLAPHAGGGWEVAWVVGAVLFEAGRRVAPATRLDWSLGPVPDGHALRLEVPPDDGLQARARALVRGLEGATISFDAQGCTLSVPNPWLIG